MLIPKTKRWEDKLWLAELRTFPCQYTGIRDTQAAHVRFGTHTGTSQKPHDYYAMSLSASEHAEQHQRGEVTFHLKMCNEYPHALMSFVRSHCKLSYLEYLARTGRTEEALEILNG